MKIAYVHVLPLEYYPPATNTLVHFATRPGWDVRAWTSTNTRGLPDWKGRPVTVRRFSHGKPDSVFVARIARYSTWHLRVAAELSRWDPDAIILVEPHSSFAVWLYYTFFRGTAPLFIHHHEYYSPEDYERPGMRLLRLLKRLDADSLLEKAVWVSQTNAARLEMMLANHSRIRRETGRILPNFPPSDWVIRAAAAPDQNKSDRTRLIYLGSASLDDTFVGEIATWVAAHPNDYSLHVVGENITVDVWRLLDSLKAPNITTQPRGCPYERLPNLLAGFDVGLVLYKGNTLNFVHNVPNKAIEYLASGLEVWYPPEMEAMRRFREGQPDQRLREVDFKSLPSQPFHRIQRKPHGAFPFTSENALRQLVVELETATETR